MAEQSKPPHYEQMEIDTITLILANAPRQSIIDYLRYQAIKYLQRAGLKEGTDDPAKARDYCDMLGEYLRTGTIKRYEVKAKGEKP